MEKKGLLLVLGVMIWSLPCILAHSFLTCTDYRPPAGMHSAASSEPGKAGEQPGLSVACFGRPRNFVEFTRQGDGYTHRPDQTKFACDVKQSRFSQLSGVEANNYVNGFQMARYKPGSDVCLEWPARNHAFKFNGDFAGGHNNWVYMVKAQEGQDADQSTFVGGLTFEIPFSDCSEVGTSNNRPCRGCFNIPANTTVGLYTFQWFWEFNDNEFYTTCWDAQVSQAGVAFKAPPPATTRVDKKARNPPSFGRSPVTTTKSTGTPSVYVAPPAQNLAPSPPTSAPVTPPSNNQGQQTPAPTPRPSSSCICDQLTQPTPAVQPSPAAPLSSSGFNVRYQIFWSNGQAFGAKIFMKPPRDIAGWTIQFQFPDPAQTVTEFWGFDLKVVSVDANGRKTVSLTNLFFNGALKAGIETELGGFNAKTVPSNPVPVAFTVTPKEKNGGPNLLQAQALVDVEEANVDTPTQPPAAIKAASNTSEDSSSTSLAVFVLGAIAAIATIGLIAASVALFASLKQLKAEKALKTMGLNPIYQVSGPGSAPGSASGSASGSPRN